MFSIKLNDYMGEEQFSTNIGSPKGDVVSGINFIFNFENALKETRFERQAFKLAQDTSNNPSDDPPPSDRFYAGDAEFHRYQTLLCKMDARKLNIHIGKVRSPHKIQKKPKRPFLKETQ